MSIRSALAALLLALVTVACQPKSSDQRVGVRVIDGQAQVLIGLCDGEALDWLQVMIPTDADDNEDGFVVRWRIDRGDPMAEGATEGQREQRITVGRVPEDFEETVPLRGPIPEPPPRLFGWLRMQTGTRAGFVFDEQAYEGDGRWWIGESQLLATTEELLAERTRVCPETAGQ